VLGINHLSYSCPDYTKARDFYTSVFGLENAPGKDTGKRTNSDVRPATRQGRLIPRRPQCNAERSPGGARSRRSHLLHALELN